MLPRCELSQEEHYFQSVNAKQAGFDVPDAYACFKCGVVRAFVQPYLCELDKTTGNWLALDAPKEEDGEQEPQSKPAARPRKK